MQTVKGQDGADLAVVGKMRKHRFEGSDPAHCAKCSKSFSAIGHK